MPPAPSSSTPGVASPSRDTVVLVATMPASPSSTARSAISSMSASERSGAILTSTGVGGLGADRGEDGPQRLDRLQVAQSRRVRRADVDHHERRQRAEQPGAFGVVVDRRLGRGGLGLADVDADRHVGGVPRQLDRQLARAVVVESHPVEQRAVVGQPEHPRLRVAGLRLRGDGADLGVPEPQRTPGASARGRPCRIRPPGRAGREIAPRTPCWPAPDRGAPATAPAGGG